MCCVKLLKYIYILNILSNIICFVQQKKCPAYPSDNIKDLSACSVIPVPFHIFIYLIELCWT